MIQCHSYPASGKSCLTTARHEVASALALHTPCRRAGSTRPARAGSLQHKAGAVHHAVPFVTQGPATVAARTSGGACRGHTDSTDAHASKAKLVAVLPRGGKAAENPEYVCCEENGLGISDLLQDRAEVFVTSDKEGPDSEFEKQLPEAEIIVTTPFHPAYLTKERLDKAKNLRLIITAGIGSDHVDLHAAAERGLTVAEVTGSNTTSVAEDNVLRIVMLMRNFLPAHQQIKDRKWDVPAVAGRAHDVMGMTIGTVGGGAIGFETMKRLQGWDVKRLYFDRNNSAALDEQGVELVKDLDELLGQCDAVTVNVPLTDKTKGMFDKATIGKLKKGAYLINNARGAIVDKHAVADAIESGQLGGYSGDVWDQQPPPDEHPWLGMPNHAMTPHISGTTLEAQQRYLEGTHNMLKAWFDGKAFEDSYYIVREGELAAQYQ